MEMTPREIAGRLPFAQKRRRRELAETMSITFMAARGEHKSVKKRVEEMSKE